MDSNNTVLGGLPHSEIHGSKLILSSSWLIAEYHVFHRLLLPRHSPNALFALDLIQKKQGRLRPLSPSAITSERILCADWTATGTKVIHFFPTAPLVRERCHFDPILRSDLVSVLDLDNTFFSGGIHEEDRGNSLRSCLPILKVLIARKLMITRLEPHRDPNPNADGSNSVDIVSLFTMSITTKPKSRRRLRTDDQTHDMCLMMCPAIL